MGRIIPSFARFLRDESGSATMEFAIVFPGLVLILFAMGEVGTFEARAVLFDRGLNFAMRDLKLGAIPNPTPENIKARICDEAFLIQRSCMEGLRLEMVPINLGAPGIADNFLASEPQCRDRVEEEINPVPEPSLDPGQRLDPMLVRACLVIDPFFPSTFMGARLKLINGDERGYALLAQTAFMNEPPR